MAVQKRARLLHDEFDAKLMAEANRNLHTLTIPTALFLPSTLHAGFFGMNLKAMPYAESDMGFWWAIGPSVVSSAATYALIPYLRACRRN